MNEQTRRVEDKSESNIDKAVTAAKEKAGPVREEVKQKSSQLINEAKSAAGQAGEEAKSMLASQKDEAARQLGGLADSLRQTSQQLRQQDQRAIATYSNKIASQIDRASSYLQERDLDALIHDAEDFARRQPEIFIGGAFTLGLLAARFLRSSAPEPEYRPQQQSYPQPTTYTAPRPTQTAVSSRRVQG
ncbi:MAG: hypothetical protein IPM53_15420 [Anaerolineaceae bacterium]|nr:hypothetical protein [Anaerolineaceae bacterium]